MSWSINKSKELYGIGDWSGGYFNLNKSGNVEVRPNGKYGHKVDLLNLIEDLSERGIHAPVLVRFPDILKSRINLLADCFKRAIVDCEYKGSYQGVFPIKVNQQRHLVEELVEIGEAHNLGLECGSKPELLIALAMMENPEALIICNGFKDEEYIETAVLSQLLGRNTIIVVDRFIELDMIIKAARKYNTTPKIGIRAKLDTTGSGKWQESSGVGSKFGLTPNEIVESVEVLKKEGFLECLELFHFHIGSQITDISCIKGAIKEGARFFTEVCGLGPKIKYVDVGGGLGVDYDGSGGSDSSVNYDEQEYANDVVSLFQQICNEKNVEHPIIVTESGRSLVAHHSILIFNVLGKNGNRNYEDLPEVTQEDHQVVHDLKEIYERLTIDNLNEYYNDLMQIKNDTLQLFTFGVLNLKQRAKAEHMFWLCATKMEETARKQEDYEDIHWNLQHILSDTYFSNFSIFQSVPDSWAVGQVFPVMPIHRHDEEPVIRAKVVDITCDSDGEFSKFIDQEESEYKETLEVHPLKADEDYYIGVFLVGAYQEILGDLHNLFGDTHAVHIQLQGHGEYTVDHFVPGDTVNEVLSYVQYSGQELLERIRRSSEKSIKNGSIKPQEARQLLRYFDAGISGYTYLEDPEKDY